MAKLQLTFSIIICVKLVNHSSKLILRHVLSQLPGDATKVPKANLPSLIIIKETKCLQELFLWISLKHPICHCMEGVQKYQIVSSHASVPLLFHFCGLASNRENWSPSKIFTTVNSLLADTLISALTHYSGHSSMHRLIFLYYRTKNHILTDSSVSGQRALRIECCNTKQ